ncbi:response regulator, partial [bacterium]|nr:response regulator [bacterium]
MKTRILVVDDSRVLRRIIRQELENDDFSIFEAEDGLVAFDKAKEIQPHLITMDVDMPKMNGFDAVRKIRTELNLLNPVTGLEIPIVFITANDTIEGRKRGFQVGATDFIVKPFLKGEVLSSVKSLLKSDNTLKGMNALIAEDSGVTRSIINNILQGEGVNTFLAANGREAFELLKAGKHEIDIVITDFMMPEMNGDELCRKIRHELGNKIIPIIFLSAMSETSMMLEIFKAGASDYLNKPFAKEELLARVRVHLESRLLNNKLLNQVHALKRLSKLKDDFISITSHDLRSPLNGILGFTNLLLQDDSINSKNKEFLTHVKDSGDFLLNLINDILDLGQAQSVTHELEMVEVSVRDLLGSSVNTVRHMATPKGIKLTVDDRLKGPSRIKGDKNALIRIFNNLLSNAIKFTSKDGEVKQIIEMESGNRISVSILDTGIGISEDKIPFLFDKFSKASRPGTAGEKSTGLGLSITKELVRRHDGKIEVISKVGKGTCFKLLFPLSVTIDADQKENEPVDLEKHGEIKILIADDNQLNIKLMTTIIRKKGYNIASAVNGKEVVEQYIRSIEEKTGKPDIIFMDLRMPVMDGFEATGEIRKFEKEKGIQAV